MAGLTREQRAAKAAMQAEQGDAQADGEQSQDAHTQDAAQAEATDDDGLVAMTKAGEVLRVHPTCVQAHKGAGWSEIIED